MLKKLKQLAEIHNQVAEVKNCIQALKSSSGSRKNDKERVLVGEMIMRLLLKLHTIQGLHPSLRDVRKALAKDLVSLQEKLGSLMMGSKELSEEGLSAVKIADGLSVNHEANMQEMQNKDMEVAENSFETCNEDVYAKECKLSEVPDFALNSWSNVTSDPSLANEEVLGSCKQEIGESQAVNGVEHAPNKELQNEAANVDVSHVAMTEVQEQKDCHPQHKQLVSQPLISQEKTCSKELMGVKVQDLGYPNVGFEAKVDGMKRVLDVDGNLKAKDSSELLSKLTEDEPSVSTLENNELGGITEKHRSEKDSNILADPTVLSGVDSMKGEADGKMATDRDSEASMTAEFPVGVLEEVLVLSNEKTETGKHEISGNGEAKCNMAVDRTSSMEVEDVAKVMVEELPGNAVTEAEENLPVRGVRDHVVTSKASPTELEDATKIMVDELPGNAVCKIEENPLCREPGYNWVSDATSPAGSQGTVKVMADELLRYAVPHIDENQLLSSTEGKDGNNAEVNDRGGVDVDELDSPELIVTSVALKDSQEAKEDEQQPVVDGNKEQEALDDKPQCLELKSDTDTDKMDEPNESEITTEKVLVSTPSSQISINENGMVVERDKKLIEENAKLREMIEKLMETGKEQLNVISHLTERVQDLEKKITKKQRLRTRKHNRATRASSNKKLFHNASADVGA